MGAAPGPREATAAPSEASITANVEALNASMHSDARLRIRRQPDVEKRHVADVEAQMRRIPPLGFGARGANELAIMRPLIRGAVIRQKGGLVNECGPH
jgi:hypothetical protein